MVHCKVARTLVLDFVIPVDSGHVFNGVLFVSAVSVALEASLEEIDLDSTRLTEVEEIRNVCLFVLLLYIQSQQLWSWRDGQFT